MKSYIFKVVLEQDKWPDEPDSEAVWRAYVPGLEARGFATWGSTKVEAMKNIQEVASLVIEDMIECGEPISLDVADNVKESLEPLVSVTIP